jgi:hypothetical protein
MGVNANKLLVVVRVSSNLNSSYSLSSFGHPKWKLLSSFQANSDREAANMLPLATRLPLCKMCKVKNIFAFLRPGFWNYTHLSAHLYIWDLKYFFDSWHIDTLNAFKVETINANLWFKLKVATKKD